MLKFNRSAWLRTCLVALMTLALFGCDDDTGEDNDTAGGDTSMTGDTAENDTTTTDDTVEGDTTTPPDTTMPPIEFSWPATPEEYVATATDVSYVATLTIPPLDANDVPTCCRDFGENSADFIDAGTSEIDNALAELANTLGELGGIDVQATLDEQLQAGTFAILWDHRDFSGEPTDEFVLAGLLGSFDAAAGTTYAEASAGNGQFVLNPASFAAGGTPIINFNPANLDAGTLSAGPATFLLSLPLGVVNLEVSVLDALLTGTAVINNGVSYTEGTLSGYVLVEELVRAINAFLGSDTCACLGLTADIYTYNDDGSITAMCMAEADVVAACPEDSQEACRTLAGGTVGGFQVCTVIGPILGGAADIDVDGDCATDPNNCAFDALSVGLEWTAVPATITGLAQ